MKVVIFRKLFVKDFRKLRVAEQDRCEERIVLFQNDSAHPLLQDHFLRGERSEQRSINIGGNLRALYRVINRETVQFVAIGTHSELYE